MRDSAAEYRLSYFSKLGEKHPDPSENYRYGRKHRLVRKVYPQSLLFAKALPEREIHRILTPDGSLAIRNGTKENDKENYWTQFFPEALENAFALPAI